jgi:tRNA nucleotidyltransferase (CCA-adding enzyme)
MDKKLLDYYQDYNYQQEVRYNNRLVRIKPVSHHIPEDNNNLPLFRIIGQLASEMKIEVYLVGGYVRDLLLKKSARDLDLVITDHPESFIIKLSRILEGEWIYHQEFMTGDIITANGLQIDLATTRREYYDYPGALPRIEKAGLVEDLFRRDYTINTLALPLTEEGPGPVIDRFLARRDLKNGLLRVLHRYSFLDDPTRIIKGIRLATKLGFNFTAETGQLIDEVINTDDLPRPTPIRILKELKLLFTEKVTDRLWQLLQRYSIFRLLNLDLIIKDKYYDQLKETETYLEYFRQKNYNIKTWLIRMAIFLDEVNSDLIKEWGLPVAEKNILLALRERHGLLSESDPEKLIILAVKTGEQKIKKYLFRL